MSGTTLRLVIYLSAAAVGIAAALLPSASAVLIPLATGLAGWATLTPGQAPKSDDKRE